MSGDGNLLQSLFTNAWGWVLIILFFNGAIVIHELGHFLAAKWRGLKVERFSIFGLGPKIFGWRGKDGVEYCFCWIPFGAFVALPQLADMKALEGDSDDADKLPPISYADKMIVAFAGPFFNLILALVLATVVWLAGTPILKSSQTNMIGYVQTQVAIDAETTVPSPAAQAGLQPGDRILQIDGEPVNDWQDVSMYIATGSGRDAAGNPRAKLLIERDGDILPVEVFPVLMTYNERSGRELRIIGISQAQTLRVGGIMPDSPAQIAGLESGDLIEAVDGQKLYNLVTLNDYINAQPGKAVTLDILRDGEPTQLTVKPEAVAWTKPLARLAPAGQPEAAIEVMPIYAPDEAGDPASADTPGQLVLFDIAEASPLEGQFKPGDVLTAVNGQPVDSLASLIAAFNSAGVDPQLSFRQEGKDYVYQAGGEWDASLVNPVTRAMIGFRLQDDFIIAHPTPGQQFTASVKMIGRVLGSLVSPRSDIGFKDLNGAIGIGRLVHRFSSPDMFDTKWDGFRAALAFAVILNVNLALLNLLPIPVLDGGHMTIATISKLLGRPMPRSLIEAATGAFVVLLFGLMAYITLFDSLDWVGDVEAKKQALREQQYQIDIAFPNDKPAE
ncbi:site-2 protease family protein [Ruficoccus amylovorans]|uniref:Site-2 protease family protein n=1 Tax=Ruficoccus amylovorans TaxID=1804625 RepID=A0A842HKC3_9BACT|nr:site-2 protease family protein [Ruficoccus amylovorans]MBC2596398.1 site-2 protease family protein [Ruficoccus amylovorans]